MGFKSFIAKPFAGWINRTIQKDIANPHEAQHKIFENLIRNACSTSFGKDHNFASVKNYEDFKKAVPVRDYEALSSYVEQIINGASDVLWPGKPIYFAKTSGTTSGSKFIPITKASIPNHINTARNALLQYIHQKGNADFTDGKMIFLSGSPILDKTGGILTGRLSGIVNHHVPGYLRSNQMPSWDTNCLEDWEEKLDQIVEETIDQDMRLISGIPPWVQMYLDRIVERSGSSVKEVFPNLQLFVHGGVNYQPYKEKMEASFGFAIDTIETFPASEGFFAYQDNYQSEGLLLNVNSGIFFEFIPLEEYFNENPTRLRLEEIELHKNYALVISSNAGLWAYSIGDTVKFVSREPYRLIVSGRVKHFISAFGEHVIAEEVEQSMRKAVAEFGGLITEFTVAPMMAKGEALPYHEWLIEFEQEPEDLAGFASLLDKEMCRQNSYYRDLIEGQILQALKINALSSGSFIRYMKSIGKLGGQNKVPRLSNDRKIAQQLLS